MEPGDSVYVPPGAPHAAFNLGDFNFAVAGNFLDKHSYVDYFPVLCDKVHRKQVAGEPLSGLELQLCAERTRHFFDAQENTGQGAQKFYKYFHAVSAAQRWE